MEIEKGKTYKYRREIREVSQAAKDNMKNFSKIKKSILEALKDDESTVEQLSEKLEMQRPELLFYLMSLLKYGYIETAGLDDMDEYFSYKLRQR